MAFDFGDIASRYASARLDRAMQPFNDPEGYMSNRLGIGEEANVKPRSTTITNNDDGTQTVTTKSEVTPPEQAPAPQPMSPLGGPVIQAEPAVKAAPQFNFAQPLQSMEQAQPAAPTPMAPVPQTPPQPQAQMPAMPAPAPQAAPVVQPPAPVTPAPVAQAPIPQPLPNIGQPPTPGPAVQLAGPMVPGAVQAPAPAPAIGPGAVTAPMAQAQPQVEIAPWQRELESAGSNEKALASFVARKDVPEEAQKLASAKLREFYKNADEQNKAEKIVMDAAQGDPKATNDLARALRSKKEEGSFLKAILFSRLGLNDLAKEEQAKLGGSTIGNSILGNQAYTIDRDPTGAIQQAWDVNGKKVDDKVLAQLNAQAISTKNVTTHTGKMQDKTTGEIYYEQTTPQGIRLVNTKGEVYGGSTANLRAYGIGSDIETKNAVQLNELQNRLAYAPLTKRLEVVAENEAKYGPLDPAIKAKILGTSTGVPQPGTVAGTVGQPSVGPGVGAGGMGVAPGAAPAQATAPTAVAGPAVPGAAPIQGPATARPIVAPAPGAIPSAQAPAVAGIVGGTPAQRETNLAIQRSAAEAQIQKAKELAVAEQKPPAEARGKNVAKDVNNQNFANETYDLIKPIADLVKQSTGSGIGAKVDTLASVFGKGTEGAQAIAQLEPLVYPILANVPRFEGSQSEYDVKTYQRAAGDFANPEKPIATRLAALQGMITLLKKYDKEGKNDWTFSGAQPGGGGIRIISRERVQ